MPLTAAPGSFAVAEARSHAEVNLVNGECFVHKPRATKANFPTGPDKSRPINNIIGCFEWESRDFKLGMADEVIVSRVPKLTVRRCDMVTSIVRGDQFLRVLDGSQFEVKAVQPDSLSGLCVELLQLGVTD